MSEDTDMFIHAGDPVEQPDQVVTTTPPEKRVPVYFVGGDAPRKRGRPRANEPRSSVSTWVPASYHDRLIKMAEQKDVSVSTLVRSMLILQIKKLGT